MIHRRTAAINLLTGLLLAGGLVLVSAYDRQHPPTTAPEPPKGNGDLAVVVHQGEKKADEAARPRLRLAVTRGEYDPMGKLLDQLGKGYSYTTLAQEDLEDPKKLESIDVLFATCALSPRSWMEGENMPGIRPGTVTRKWNLTKMEPVKANLRQFVARGGTLYASDFQFPIIWLAFPELIQHPVPGRGDKQELVAEVTEPGLQGVIGAHLPLRFDLAGWYPAAFKEANATVYLRGAYLTADGQPVSAPLLVKVPFEKGVLLFTSFHNEKQNSERELQLLRYLVFAAVTAQVETEVKQTMTASGFTPQQHNLLSSSSGAPAVTQSYTSKKAGPLLFALGFTGTGARLRLTVTAPDGRWASREGTEPFTIEVPEAGAGEWKYTVTALDLPYANFPFTVTVGEK